MILHLWGFRLRFPLSPVPTRILSRRGRRTLCRILFRSRFKAFDVVSALTVPPVIARPSVHLTLLHILYLRHGKISMHHQKSKLPMPFAGKMLDHFLVLWAVAVANSWYLMMLRRVIMHRHREAVCVARPGARRWPSTATMRPNGSKDIR